MVLTRLILISCAITQQISLHVDGYKWLSQGGPLEILNLCEYYRLKCLLSWQLVTVALCSDLITKTQWDIIFPFYIMKPADGTKT